MINALNIIVETWNFFSRLETVEHDGCTIVLPTMRYNKVRENHESFRMRSKDGLQRSHFGGACFKLIE